MNEELRKAVEDIAVEAWRFQSIFQRMLTRMDPMDAARYANQYSWFRKKVDEAVEKTGLKLVNMEGQLFDTGMAITPLNIDEFDIDEPLFVQRMIEPVIMHEGRVCRTGSAMLGRVEE